MTESQKLKPLKNGRGRVKKSAKKRSLKIPSSIKAIRKLAQIVRIKFFRILEINQRFAAI